MKEHPGMQEKPSSGPLDGLFRPRSIAVIGASREPHTIGNTILWNLARNGFTGAVYPVNPKASSVHSIRAYPDVREIPDEIDLAVIAVPASRVLDVATACVEKRVRGLCVITAGFSEVGDKGRAQQQALVELCRAHGIRLLGPNCMGLVNTDPEVRMNATFARTFPRAGGLALLSQSGAMGVMILDHAEDLGLGLSMFASLGNKADVSGNDLLEYWERDPKTKIVLMYLEGFGNPRKFIPIARRVSRTKPIVCVKAGRTEQGSKAAASHTGSLAGADVAANALLEQTGVLRVDSVGEMFDVAQALTTQPLPAGSRVAILTNAGGPAILATDFLVAKGLELATLSDATKAALRKALAAEASVANPVDMIASAGAKEYGTAIPLLLGDAGVDIVLTMFVPPITADPVGVARTIFEASRGSKKPVLGCFIARNEVIAEIKRLDSAWFPLYDYPEDAVRAAHNLVRVRALRDDDLGEPVAIEGDRAAAKKALGKGGPGGWLAGEDAFRVLAAYGVRCAPFQSADSVEAAVAAASKVAGLGEKIALKLDGEAFLHKSDVGGVALDLGDTKAVRAAATRLDEIARRAAPGKPFRFLVQRMAAKGVELVIGARTDPVFGPLLGVGLGGIHVEVLKDVRFGLVPMTPITARRLLSRLRAYPILKGHRGAPPVDLDAVVDTLLRLSALVDEHPEIAEVEMNPVIVRPDGVEAVDARLRVRTQG